RGHDRDRHTAHHRRNTATSTPGRLIMATSERRRFSTTLTDVISLIFTDTITVTMAPPAEMTALYRNFPIVAQIPHGEAGGPIRPPFVPSPLVNVGTTFKCTFIVNPPEAAYLIALSDISFPSEGCP
ncbi:MAG: hypothetical protein AB7F35_20355, partial [Acetobacteraceae bacterium]